ncbi:hypothetical protein [Bacillus sp. Marseille-Q3570]|uniref:hypothetical protein n=1 Tax=Bacillus sp. Marseille-Q3570 TaxID=2963522 RepID=UPI0021B83D98|nr:hypothetical protein [Bacillus sp. Marseille-Q3570]
MSFLDGFGRYSIIKKRILNITIALCIVFILVAILLPNMKLSTKAAALILPFDISTPVQLPFDSYEEYTSIAGFDRAKVVYENNDEELILWITTEIGWNKVADWERTTLEDGTVAHFTELDETQVLSWQKNDVEYALDYSGPEYIAKNELVNIANSIE